ncbi:MAG: HEAT repeat domain-containing protein [Armatimonadota bacterium]
MLTDTTNPLLMGCSLDSLRCKLSDPASPLAPWWQHMLTLARQDPIWYSPYTVLAAVVTGEDEYRELARKSFLRYIELRREAETSMEAQYHTHVFAAPLGQWAIFYDWVADLGLFSPQEDAAFRETMIDLAYIFPLQHIQSRACTFENQIFSNAFGAAAVGYVFGIKRGEDAQARRLFSSGLSWLQELLGRLPKGGYSPEGSTYHEQVVVPMTLIASVLLEEVTGHPIFEKGLPPDHHPMKELLTTSYRMIGPGGLLPPWDAYGYQPATIKSGLAYLARITGDPGPLAAIRACNMWYRIAHPCWEISDRMWSMVWWPSEIDQVQPATFPSWMVPEVAGALQESSHKIRLFQYWDECGGVPTSGRSQVDPNAVSLDAFQSPILLDGYGHPNQEVLPLPIDDIVAFVGERTLETIQEYIHAAWGAHISREEAANMAMDGSVGMSNALVLDGEGWYVPLSPKTGEGKALHVAGPLQVITSDATTFYTDRYDVSRVSRTSAMVDGKYLLVSDRVQSASPHTVTWQAYVRREAEAQGGGVVIHTPEQVRCDLVPLQAGELTLTEVEGYPRLADSRSILVRHTVPASTDLRLDVGLAPQNTLQPVVDLTEDWQRDIAGHIDSVSLATAYLDDPGTEQASPRIFRRKVTTAPEADRRYFITLPFAGNQVQLSVNGMAIQPETVSRGIWEESTSLLPYTFEVTDALLDGENEITITAPYFHGETVCGPVMLSLAQEPSAVRFARTGKDTFAISHEQGTDVLLLDHEGGTTELAGGSTNAQHALLAADGTVAACAATELSLPGGLTVQSQAPCDQVWTESATTLAKTGEGSSVEFTWPTGHLQIEIAGCITITYQGQRSHTLTLEVALQRTVVVNGHAQGVYGGPGQTTVVIDLQPGACPQQSLTTVEQVYALAEQCGQAAGDAFIAVLQGDDWRMQLAAADVIGRLHISAAVPVLLERFAEGEAELPYPELTKWWRASKMLRGPNKEEGFDPNLPMPLAVKRWRVKRAVITALGKIGDQRAVAPLEAALIRCDDFFPVTSQLAVALGRLGSNSSIAVLERHFNHAEFNTRHHSRLSLALIKGDIDRAAFEAQIGGIG